MRVTNSMISKNSMSNMNNNKLNVSKLNNQMSSQKKILRPSEDPVIAIRALRLRSNLNELNQYFERNIPDAQSWLEVTEGALDNMEKILDSVYKKCDQGANDTLSEKDRAAILKDLESARHQIYAEGNADCIGRTVFTGYKTNSKLTFSEDENDTKYEISEKLSYKDIEEERFYGNLVDLPASSQDVLEGVAIEDMPQDYTHKRIRLSYEGLDDLSPENIKYIDEDGNEQYLSDLEFQSGNRVVFANVTTTKSYSEWAKEGYRVGANEAIFFKETGELILGDDLANYLGSSKTELSIDYSKQGFKKGELRPEHYFNCKDVTDANHPITYTKSNQEIQFTIAFNQSLTVNTQASDVLDTGIGRDIDEMANVVEAAVAAHDKVDKLKAMKKETQYADPEYQEALDEWIEAAEKEAAYADDNLQKTFAHGMTKFQEYKKQVTLARTDLGSREDRLNLTNNRMSNQQATFENLKARNEDKELSDIIIEFTAAYNAYQASLQASAKANGQTLLNYL
ncbi:flagellar hook-associated protein FlgL [Lachnospiraceae bacterium 29-84]